jgi:hypothetical protein
LRRFGVLRACLLGVTVAGAALLVLMLADHIYDFRPATRTGLLALAAAAVGVVVTRQLRRAAARRADDVQVATFVEKRHPELQGSLLSAVEFERKLRPGGSQAGEASAVRRYIVDVLIEDATRRLRGLDVRGLIRPGRLARSILAALVVLLLLGLNAALLPNYFLRQSQRVLTPWFTPAGQYGDDARRLGMRRETFLTGDLKSPIHFRITPGDVEITEGGRIEVTAALSRSPLNQPVLLCYRSQEGPFQQLPMRDVQRVYEYARSLEDVTKRIEYYVQAGGDASEHFHIAVQQLLRVEGFELTYNYPDYLRRPPRKVDSQVGDISAVEGSKVSVRIRTNRPAASGILKLTAGGEIPLTIGPTGAVGVVPVTANDTYHYVLKDEKGRELRSDSMFFIEAVPDKPPKLEIVGPNIDLMVHPVSEMTVTVKVSEDQALADLRLHYEVMREADDGTVTREARVQSFLPAGWTEAVSEAQAAYSLALEDLKPPLRSGDSIVYHVQAEDRKGQKAVSDMFNVIVTDFAQCAFYGKPHAPHAKDVVFAPLMKFIAAAWELEQQRGTLAAPAFLERSKGIAALMIHPTSNAVINFMDKKGLNVGLESNPQMAEAYQHTVAGHKLLDEGEPGKAVVELKLALAIESRFHKIEAIESVWPGGGNFNIKEASMGLSAKMKGRPLVNVDDAPPMPDPKAILDPSYARKMGRNDVEKLAEVRKDIAKLRDQVAKIDDNPQEPKDQPKPAGKAGQDQPGTDKPRPRPAGAGTPGQDQKDQANRPPQPGQARAGTDANDAAAAQTRPAGGADPNAQPKAGQKTGQPPKGDQPRDIRPGETKPDALARRANEATTQAEALADRLHQQLEGRDNKEIREGLNDLRAAAARLQRANREFKRGMVDPGLAEAREADRLLGTADKALAGAEQKSLNEMLAEATRQAYRIADRQVRVQAAIDELAKHDAQHKASEKAGRQDLVAQESARREGVVAALEALGDEAKGFRGQLDKTNETAKQAKDPAVGQFVGEAARVMNRQDLPQDMVDSAMNIRQGDLAAARKAQDGAGKAIQQTLDALNNATDVLSGTRTGAIERASRIAQKVKADAKNLVDKMDGPGGPQTRPATAAGNQATQPGKGEDQARTGEKPQPGKGEDQARTGEKPQPGKGEDQARTGEKPQPGKGEDQARTGEKPQPGKGEDQTRTGEKPQPGKGPDQARTGEKPRPGETPDKTGPRQPGDRRPGQPEEVVAHSTQDQDVAQLWSDVRVLVRQLRTLDVVPRQAVDMLDRTSQSQEEFRKIFERLQKQDAVAFVGVVGEVAERMAADLEKAKAERKLQTGLREECPPVYRRLVGMYYKALSGGNGNGSTNGNGNGK